jgi:hypothetical protein
MQFMDVVGQQATLVSDVFALSGGLPTGSALATSAPVTITSTTPTVQTYAFSSPATLASGTQYAAVLREISATGVWETSLVTPSAYAGGVWIRNISGGGWGVFPTVFDLYFATRVRTALSAGKVAQLYAIDTASQSVHAQLATFIGYGSDITGLANTGVSFYAWHDADNRWVTLGSNTAGSSDTDAAKTITAELVDSGGGYVDDDGDTYLMVVTTYAGITSLAAQVVTDQLNLISFVDSAISAESAAGNVSFEGFEGAVGVRYEGFDNATLE